MLRNLIRTVLIISIILVVIGRIYIALVRFIDPDEFAYLHWTYLLSTGKVPYLDFFLYHIPLYQFMLIPIFFLPYSSFLVYLARFWELIIYFALVFILVRLTFLVSKSKQIVLLAILIFLVFPMTLDKTIDLRPDVLMMLFFLGSVYLAWQEHLTLRFAAIIGLSFGLSLMTFPKIIFALPSLVFILYVKHKSEIRNIKTLGILTLAGAMPFLIFFLYLLVTGSFTLAAESITKGALAVSAGKIPFSPWLALSPWPVVYVTKEGVSFPWIINTVIWLLAIPGLLIIWSKNKTAGLFLFIFFAFGIFFIYAFPAPYTQYFLPLSVFACFLAAVTINYFADFLDRIINKNSLKASTIFFIVIAFFLLTSFFIQYRERISSDNNEQMTVIDTILTVSKPEETFYDMVGSYIFRPDGYIICCHPYAEFFGKLPHKPPSLPESLIANKTKFIVLDRTGQSFWKPIPSDLDFLFRHYIESPYKKIYILGAKFNCENGSCTQVNINNQPIVAVMNSFDIIIEENYIVETDPPNQSIIINGTSAGNSPLVFKPGQYTFTVPLNVTSLKIRLAR